MKNLNIISILLFGILFSHGCGEKTKEIKDVVSETQEIVKKTSKEAIEAPKTLNHLEALTKMTPVSDDAIKAWMPEELLGMPREFFNSGLMSQFGISSAAATFKQKANTYINIKFVDGAGEKGVTAIGPFFMTKSMEVNRESASGYEKTVEQDGIKASERYTKSNEKYRITFLYKERLGITIESENLDREIVWKAIDAFDFDALLASSK